MPIVGHEKTIEDLKRLAGEKQLAHGYVFFGPSMIGKCLVALSFAHFLESGDFISPKILQDGLLVEADEKGTIGIDAIRQIKNFLWQKPNVGPRRVVIIDRAELLTTEAQNALLKIAEEPPPSTLLILVTSDVDRFTPTLSSRLQKIYFSAAPRSALAKWACERFGLTAKVADDLAYRSFGKVGLAVALMQDKKFQATLKSAENLLKLGWDKRRDFIKKLMEAEDFSLADLLDALIIIISEERFGDKGKIARWHRFLSLRQEVAYWNLNPRLQLENLLIANY